MHPLLMTFRPPTKELLGQARDHDHLEQVREEGAGGCPRPTRPPGPGPETRIRRSRIDRKVGKEVPGFRFAVRGLLYR